MTNEQFEKWSFRLSATRWTSSGAAAIGFVGGYALLENAVTDFGSWWGPEEFLSILFAAGLIGLAIAYIAGTPIDQERNYRARGIDSESFRKKIEEEGKRS